jgi:tetratricopeptide (TPR) repeat protein
MGIWGVGRLGSASFLLISLFLSDTSAQSAVPADPGSLHDSSTSCEGASGTGSIALHLYSENTTTRFERQAVLKLTNLVDQSVTWQTIDNDSPSVFTNIPCSGYEIETSAAGYLTALNKLEVTDPRRPVEIVVVLQRDPSATSLDPADPIVSAKARKLTKRAIGMLKSEHLAQAEKQLDQARRLAPASPDLNFLLGYLYFKKKDLARAGEYLARASNLSPQNAQALTLLGRVGLEREDYPAARSTLEQAVLLDFENWLPHSLLAATYLRQSDYQRACEEAEIAIRKGKQAASPSRLILGKSLYELGRNQEAVEAFAKFLQESPQHPMAAPVRSAITEIQDHFADAPREWGPASGRRIPELDPLAALPTPEPSPRWQPRGVDEGTPYVAPAVVCPGAKVFDEAGQRAVQLVQDVDRFAAVESLLHQALDDYGIPTRTITRKYNYVASMSEPQPGSLFVDEFRAEKLTLEGYPDHIATSGFAVLALVFHPHIRKTFAMSCEGLGDWQGHASWLVHFRQLDDRPNHIHSYKVGNRIIPVALKGRAWISADKFQILRMEAEIVAPVPEIHLLSEHQVVEYGPVPFPRKNTTVWLPKNAQIYFDLRKHHYYRLHSFDHYMLYSVETDSKPKDPALPPG